MKRILFFLAFSLLASAIYAADDYRIVTIQVLKPAKQPITFTDRSVAIYSTQYVTDAKNENYVFRNDTTHSRSVALAIKKSLEEWESLEDYDIPVYDFYAFCNGDNCDDSIESINDYDLLIAVKEVEISSYQTAQAQYADNYGNYFSIGTYAPYKVVVEVYDTDKKQFLAKETLEDTLEWSKNVLNIQTGLKDLPSQEEGVEYAIEELGQLFTRSVAPYWIAVERFFFVPSGKDFKKAADYAEAMQWDEAMKIWTQYAGSTNRKIAGQSAFNMALVCEVNGDYELALEWLTYAEKQYNIREINGYRTILQRRINESKILEEQLQDL